jgi:hypothetical protein
MIYTAMCMMQAAYITLASERGLGPGNFHWWAPNRLDAILQDPKKVSIPGPNPLPIALVMDVARIKIIMHVAI